MKKENIKISYLNCDDKYIKKYKTFFVNNLEEVDDKIKDYCEDISKENKLYNDYIKLKFIYDNGGLLLDGNFEFLNPIDSFYNNNIFIAYKDNINICTNIIWAKEKNNFYVGKILEMIKENKFDNLTDIFSEILNKDLKKNDSYLVNYNNEIYIYPYDYFFPIDYETVGKKFTGNIKSIYYEKGKKLPKNSKTKIKFAKKYGVEALSYFVSTLRTLRDKLGHKKYVMSQNIKKRFSIKQDTGIDKAVDILNKYISINEEAKHKQEKLPIDYVIIHNPNWLGVTSATKELFTNLLPLEEVYLDKNVNIISKLIVKLGVSQVIFSAFDYGWDKIAIELKKLNKDIKIKSFWHGSHSQVIEKINWETNLMVIDLHKKGIIDVMGTCKESLVNFYKSQGYRTAFIKNNVILTDNVKEKLKNVKKSDTDKLKIGIYSAGTDWRKNTYNQVMAASLFDNAILELVPLRKEIQRLATENGLVVRGSNTHLKRDELLLKMAENDITLYVTFSECAPMLPIESLEAGTICITGNNHHYFKGTKLYDYLVVEREDDVIAIYDKIKYAIENKDEIFKLYKEWKKQNDIESKQSVTEFLNM